MKWFKAFFKILAILVGLLLLVCGGLIAYLVTHKDKVMAAAVEELKQHVNGELHVGHAALKLSAHLPGVAISLEDVWVRDSLWQRHHQTLISAKQFYLTLNPLPLLTGKVRAGTLEIRDGQICLFTDSTGYSNTSAFKSSEGKKKNGGKQLEINNLRLTNMHIIVRHEARDKDFDFAVQRLAVKREELDDGWHASVQLRLKVKSMAFNTVKGSFLAGKQLAATLKCDYSETQNAITIPLQELMIDKQGINMRGKFSFREGESARFELYFGSDGIKYKEALTMLTPGIYNKIPAFDFANPVAVQATLIGRTAYRDTPHVHVAWQVRDNTFTTPGGTINNCSFRGSYDNERVPGAGYKDPNALLTVAALKGQWEGIDLTVDTLNISDLINPVLEGKLSADADVDKLNNVAGESVFLFGAGHLHTDLAFKGALKGADTAQPYVRGSLRIDNATVTYRPRGIKLTNTNARIRFNGDDVIADTLTLSCGSSAIGLHGTFKDFLHLFYTSPDKIVMTWNLNSKLIDLTELVPLLKAPTYEVRKPKGNHVSMIPHQLGEILLNNEIIMNVAVDKLVYKDFEATKVSGRLALDSAGFRLQDAKLNQANGTVAANVMVRQEKKLNRYEVNAKVKGVGVRPFFKAFGNFGQDAVTYDEIDGIFSADVRATGYLDGDGKPVKRSINGEAAFSLSDGSLVNFGPMKVIGALLFRKRQMDSITFREVSSTLTIKEGKIFVPPLHIESNAITLMVQGVYATSGAGTNLEIDVPLRNPNKDSMITNEALRHARHMKGVVLHLRATKEDEGDLKIRFR